MPRKWLKEGFRWKAIAKVRQCAVAKPFPINSWPHQLGNELFIIFYLQKTNNFVYKGR